MAEEVARTEVTVLIEGESGTGKELVARMIHARSARAERPFIFVNCAALPEQLLEAELFGHVKGAFTGAVASKPGRFQLADGGTLFLDEIGDLPAKGQGDLLRVLEDGCFRMVGGTELIRVNVRVVAATNKQLQQAVAAGRFREDLFYRLNIVPIAVPPLREHAEDIPLLVETFLRQFTRQTQTPAPAALGGGHAAVPAFCLARQRPAAAQHHRAARAHLPPVRDRSWRTAGLPARPRPQRAELRDPPRHDAGGGGEATHPADAHENDGESRRGGARCWASAGARCNTS